mmetsp:Transcript_108613/g.315899  ORF Transcript_108613/g.315899 Transcript_108613/m.315899 type:complete len:243 (-) Transcript_108613:687-1415(-)
MHHGQEVGGYGSSGEGLAGHAKKRVGKGVVSPRWHDVGVHGAGGRIHPGKPHELEKKPLGQAWERIRRGGAEVGEERYRARSEDLVVSHRLPPHLPPRVGVKTAAQLPAVLVLLGCAKLVVPARHNVYCEASALDRHTAHHTFLGDAEANGVDQAFGALAGRREVPSPLPEGLSVSLGFRQQEATALLIASSRAFEGAVGRHAGYSRPRAGGRPLFVEGASTTRNLAFVPLVVRPASTCVDD